MMETPNLQSEFNKRARDLPATDFARCLDDRFGDDTARNVLGAFKKVGLPAPENKGEFLVSTEGALVFLNRYGVIIRIEHAETKDSPSGFSSDRINDSQWILKPLASIDAGKAIVEICPGCRFENKEANSDYLRKTLHKQGIDFWDDGVRNTGRLPISTVKFPEGVPIVIDRLAVRKLTVSVDPIRWALSKAFNLFAKNKKTAQEELYAPLRSAFEGAYPDAGKMASFWALCQSYVAEGKLVAGWNDFAGEFGKTAVASRVAKHYEVRLSTANHSPASAAPQSPHRPI